MNSNITRLIMEQSVRKVVTVYWPFICPANYCEGNICFISTCWLYIPESNAICWYALQSIITVCSNCREVAAWLEVLLQIQYLWTFFFPCSEYILFFFFLYTPPPNIKTMHRNATLHFLSGDRHNNDPRQAFKFRWDSETSCTQPAGYSW